MQHGLTTAEAAKRLAERGELEQHAGSRSYGSIVRENVLTLFNLMLAACAVALIATGQIADLLFAGVIVINAGIGIWQEVRAPSTRSSAWRCSSHRAPARCATGTRSSWRSTTSSAATRSRSVPATR